MTGHRIIFFALFLALAGAPRQADARHYIYYHDYHPIPEAFGGGLCGDRGAHPHEYAPVDLDLYVVRGGVYYFIGDPSAFLTGVVGIELYWYHDHHPVPPRWGGGVCYLSGPHRHWFLPPPGGRRHYVVSGGRYMYRGPWSHGYRPERHVRQRVLPSPPRAVIRPRYERAPGPPVWRHHGPHPVRPAVWRPGKVKPAYRPRHR